MVHRLRWIIALLVVLLVSSVFAQSATPAQIEWVGLIEAVDGQSVTLQGQTLNISGADVEATLEAGKLVKAKGQVAEGGSISVLEIYVPRKAIFGIRIEGVISAISTESLTINGLVIGLNGLELSDDFAVGVVVKVELDSSWTARQVALGGPEDESAHAEDDAETTPDPEAAEDPSDDDDGSSDSDDSSHSDDSDGSSDDDDRLRETVAFSAEQALAAVLALYPNALIIEIEFYGATWEVRTAEYEIEISSSTGDILRIESDMDDDAGLEDDLPSSVTFSLSQAIAAALALYPNTEVVETSWDDDGYWEITLNNNLELRFSSADGTYLGAFDLLTQDEDDDEEDDDEDEDDDDDDEDEDDDDD